MDRMGQKRRARLKKEIEPWIERYGVKFVTALFSYALYDSRDPTKDWSSQPLSNTFDDMILGEDGVLCLEDYLGTNDTTDRKILAFFKKFDYYESYRVALPFEQIFKYLTELPPLLLELGFIEPAAKAAEYVRWIETHVGKS